MANIYQLTENYLKLQQMIEAGDFSEEDLQDTIEMVTDEIEDKAESYGFVITNLNSQADGLDKEIKRLSDRKKTITNGVTSLEKSLSASMIATDHLKFKTNHFSFGFRKSEVVTILDQPLLDIKYCNVKTVETPNKKLIKEALKEGKEVIGAELTKKQNFFMK